ncbi:MAG TPA: CHAD domain-containing protein, partial [Chitinophagaceae bacterium]
MAAENILLHHWETELARLKENIHSYTNPDTEMTHKIRVGIKKLRAYFKLYLFIYKREETKELFKPTEDLFSLLGRHRNIQINKE